jgi:hypothetical protein
MLSMCLLNSSCRSRERRRDDVEQFRGLRAPVALDEIPRSPQLLSERCKLRKDGRLFDWYQGLLGSWGLSPCVVTYHSHTIPYNQSDNPAARSGPFSRQHCGSRPPKYCFAFRNVSSIDHRPA